MIFITNAKLNVSFKLLARFIVYYMYKPSERFLTTKIKYDLTVAWRVLLQFSFLEVILVAKLIECHNYYYSKSAMRTWAFEGVSDKNHQISLKLVKYFLMN